MFSGKSAMAALRADARLSSPPPGRLPMGGLVDITGMPGVARRGQAWPGSSTLSHAQPDSKPGKLRHLASQFYIQHVG